MRQQVKLVEQGQITRRQHNARFAHYVVPLSVAGDDDRTAYVPVFNEAISPTMSLWPQVRARWDAERVCLVSTERNTGWLHDLWFPGYLWADTKGKWLVPGMTYHGGMSSYEIQDDRLIAAFDELQRQETAVGHWRLGGKTLPFGEELQDRFPLVARFLDQQGQPAVSRLSSERVVKILTGTLCRPHAGTTRCQKVGS